MLKISGIEMTNTIYIVYASKNFYYEGSHNSVVFTTFCSDEAISFAKKYEEKANTLLKSFMSCDYVAVSVISSVIGQPNTEGVVWTSRGFSVSAEENTNNTSFSIEPEAALLEKIAYSHRVEASLYHEIKPKYSFGAGLSPLDVDVHSHTFDFTQYNFDKFPYFYSVAESTELVNEALSKGFVVAIDLDSQSKENRESWDTYRLYEQKYFLR